MEQKSWQARTRTLQRYSDNGRKAATTMGSQAARGDKAATGTERQQTTRQNTAQWRQQSSNNGMTAATATATARQGQHLDNILDVVDMRSCQRRSSHLFS